MSSDPVVHYLTHLRQIFDLRSDNDEDGTVENIRKNVNFQSATAWTLVFAIFIASIGLNVNSAAVIIGAMLISPLMGPILGFGLALGINDSELLRRSLRNLSIAVVISVVTSTIYFLLSPLDDVQSELLARTQPTFYDVLIAFFGGAAGIVSMSRKERGGAVAGVAIATALMPPLCTAGFALASGNMKFFAGAIYLFLINSVFIGLSTFLFVRYLKFKRVKVQNEVDQKKLNRWLAFVVIVVVFPSLVLAWNLMRQSQFNSRAERFVREGFKFQNSMVVDKDFRFRYDKQQIEVSLIGTTLTTEQVEALNNMLPLYKLHTTELKVRQLVNGADTEHLVTGAEAELLTLRQELRKQAEWSESADDMEKEIKVIYPDIERIVTTSEGHNVIWKKRTSKAILRQVDSFVKVRMKNQAAEVYHLVKAQI